MHRGGRVLARCGPRGRRYRGAAGVFVKGDKPAIDKPDSGNLIAEVRGVRHDARDIEEGHWLLARLVCRRLGMDGRGNDHQEPGKDQDQRGQSTGRHGDASHVW